MWPPCLACFVIGCVLRGIDPASLIHQASHKWKFIEAEKFEMFLSDVNLPASLQLGTHALLSLNALLSFVVSSLNDLKFLS